MIIGKPERLKGRPGGFVAKTLYPEQFSDIDPKKKADEIFTFLVGRPVFEKLNAALKDLAFGRLLCVAR